MGFVFLYIFQANGIDSFVQGCLNNRQLWKDKDRDSLQRDLEMSLPRGIPRQQSWRPQPYLPGEDLLTFQGRKDKTSLWMEGQCCQRSPYKIRRLLGSLFLSYDTDHCVPGIHLDLPLHCPHGAWRLKGTQVARCTVSNKLSKSIWACCLLTG